MFLIPDPYCTISSFFSLFNLVSDIILLLLPVRKRLMHFLFIADVHFVSIYIRYIFIAYDFKNYELIFDFVVSSRNEWNNQSAHCMAG